MLAPFVQTGLNKAARAARSSSSTRAMQSGRGRTMPAPVNIAAASETGEAVAKPGEQSRVARLVGDSEIIILHVKPSLLYIVLSSLGSLFGLAFVALLLAFVTTFDFSVSIPWAMADAFMFGMIMIALRLGWQALDWASRSYILTDRRIIVTWGVARRRFLESTLFRIEHIAVVQTARERVFSLGTITFATRGSATYDLAWFMISKPFERRQIIVDAIDRYGGHHPSSE